MRKGRESMGLISRRHLLKQAVGGVALATAFPHPGYALSEALSGSSVPRIRENIDFGWKFLRGDSVAAHQPEFADSGWRNVDLPHDWSIEGPYSEKEPAGAAGGYLPTGIGWYRKRFLVPEAYRDRTILVEFDGIYQNSEVWINGEYLGRRPYGYIPFTYELTPNLHFGSENLIAVRVDNSHQTNCRWYSGSGIYRHTWLLVTNQVHIAHWGTFVTFPLVSSDAATCRIETTIRNDRKNDVLCTLATSILDRDGKTVGAQETSQMAAANRDYTFEQRLTVDKPNLWSLANPYMYTVRCTLAEHDRVLDVYETPIGIREALFDADKGFLLNGEHVKLNGVCLHHEAGSFGAAVPERVWERRLEVLREMGCNAIRTSHNPYAAEFLDLCDKLGFLVMNEAFDEWKVPKGQIGRNGYSLYFDEWYERDLKNFVRRDRNHPSVVLWSAGNEIGDQSAPNGSETLRKLLDVFHREDPTRPVTAGCDHIVSEPPPEAARPEFLALLDIVGYNYVDRWRDRIEKYYSIDREAFPRRRFIGTESTALGGIRGDYRGLVGNDSPGRFGRFQKNCQIDVEQLWKFVRIYDYVAGDFMWTGIDYLGEAFWPMKGAPSGVIDTCGFKKDGFYFYQSQWTDKLVLHLFPHWNWKGEEGRIIPVMCFTNCDTVELFLNGKSLGVKGFEFPRLGMEGRYGNYPPRARVLRTTADLHLSWDVPYEPGTLKAVGTKDGNSAVIAEVSTTGEPAVIALSADRGRIAADQRDVVHIVGEIRDVQGRVVPTAANDVVFEIQGEGKIIGVDNGDPQSHEDYKSNRRKAFNGLCMAIIQSNRRPGQIRLTASSPGLQGSSVTITTAA